MITRTYPIPGPVDAGELTAEIETLVGVRPKLSRQGGMIGVGFDNDVRVDEQALEDVIAAHRPGDVTRLEQAEAKAERVLAGTDSFTQGQEQEAIARLILIVARYLR